MRRRTIRTTPGYVLVEPARHEGRRAVAVAIEESLHRGGLVHLRPGQARQLAALLIECAEQQERWR